MVGYTLGRRGLLKGAAGAAALGLGLPAGLARAQVELGTATGELTVGSNYSNELPKEALHAAIEAFPNENVTIKLNEVDHNTFQENITTYLQNPDDVIPWFAGYRMQFFAAQGLLGPIDDVWEAGLNDIMSEGFKLASTGQDGKLYFVPMTYYCWGIHYRPSLFEENGLDGADDHGRADGSGRRTCRTRASSPSRSATTAAGRRWARSISSTSA